MAAFSANGRLIVTGGLDRSARVWETSTGKLLARLAPHANTVFSAEFSPGGRRVVTTTNGSGQVWDVAQATPIGEPLRHAELSRVSFASFSPDGRRVITVGGDHTARLWDAATGKAIGAVMKHDGEPFHAAFRPDGLIVVTGGHDRTVRFWDAITGRAFPDLTLKLEQPLDRVFFTSDAAYLVTRENDRFVALYRFDGKKYVKEESLEPGLTSLSYREPERSPDMRLLLEERYWSEQDFGGAAHLWDEAGKIPQRLILRHDVPIRRALFLPGGQHLLTLSGDATYPQGAELWDVSTGQADKPAHGPTDSVIVACSRDGLFLLRSNPKTKQARIVERTSGRQVGPPLPQEGTVYRAWFSDDGRWLATAATEPNRKGCSVGLWNAATGAAAVPVLDLSAHVTEACIAPNGKTLALLGQEGELQLWNVAVGRCLRIGEQTRFDAVVPVFSPDGKLVAAAEYWTARVFDAGTGAAVAKGGKHGGPIRHLAFSGDSSLLIAASEDRVARVWRARGGSEVTPPLQHKEALTFAVFSPDSRRVATASEDGTARVWDARTGWPLSPFFKHDKAVNHLDFSRDGRWLATASTDQTVKIWNVAADDRPVEDLVALARLIAGERVKDDQKLVNIGLEETRTSWERLRQKYPDDFACTPDQERNWHREEARACRSVQNWPRALLHLDRLLALGPKTAVLHMSRGDVLSRLRRPADAIAEFTAAMKMKPDVEQARRIRQGLGNAHAELDHWKEAAAAFRDSLEKTPEVAILHRMAFARLGGGDHAGYVSACREVLRHSGDAPQSPTATAIAWLCALGPDNKDNIQRFLAATALVKAFEADTRPDEFHLARGALLYRVHCGIKGKKDWQEVIKELEAARAVRGTEQARLVPCWLYLAMAHHQNGNRAEAARWLTAAEQWAASVKKQGAPFAPWDARLQIRLLLAEAKATIGPKPAKAEAEDRR
jgi:WD40 repeat protein